MQARLIKTGRLRISLAIIAVMLLSTCSKSIPLEITQAVSVFKQMSNKRNLSRSAFPAAFGQDGTPKQYVSYLFSAMGKAEWPIPLDKEEESAMRAARIITIPKNIAILPRQPDLEKGLQLVLNYDNGRGMILAQGYINGKDKPVLRQEWVLPKVTPDPFAKRLFEQNRDLGIEFQSF